MLLADEISIDDIIFGRNKIMCRSFCNEMREEFEMSMIREVKIFIGFQVQ